MKARTNHERLMSRAAIDRVTEIRVRNNLLWMRLLKLAVESSPEKAKKIIKKITDNDRRITSWLSRV